MAPRRSPPPGSSPSKAGSTGSRCSRVSVTGRTRSASSPKLSRAAPLRIVAQHRTPVRCCQAPWSASSVVRSRVAYSWCAHSSNTTACSAPTTRNWPLPRHARAVQVGRVEPVEHLRDVARPRFPHREHLVERRRRVDRQAERARGMGEEVRRQPPRVVAARRLLDHVAHPGVRDEDQVAQRLDERPLAVHPLGEPLRWQRPRPGDGRGPPLAVRAPRRRQPLEVVGEEPLAARAPPLAPVRGTRRSAGAPTPWVRGTGPGPRWRRRCDRGRRRRRRGGGRRRAARARAQTVTKASSMRVRSRSASMLSSHG